MHNIVLATTTAFVLALGTASAFAADGHDNPQTEAPQSGDSNQGAGVANQGNGGCANILASPAAYSNAAVASCRITNV
jgi:hypothetical protein